ncbi:MAG: HU family DNA-binding protein [Ignavibacteria bacterium]
MGKALSKSEIIAKLAEKNNLTKKQVKQLLEDLANLAYEEAKNSFTLPGFGKLVLVERKERIARNPRTGEMVQVPAKKVVKFKVAKACKEAVLSKS